jgi:alkanesulfonate monooxygenase SsuD/methylene tetrahydromethanopterin reductase-like flavin-dependent oxidoreductase (luciferase family)
MEISIALPNTVPGADGSLLTAWAARAEELGFAGVAATERLVYPGIDPLPALAAAAAATSAIRLSTNVLIGPLRSAAVLCKEVEGLDRISGGRFVLGVGPGVRQDDFDAAERDYAGRGAVLDRQLEALTDPAAGPRGGRVPILVAGLSDAAVRRTARFAQGWTAPGLEPDQILPFTARIRAAWQDAGRAGAPRIVVLARFALGEDVQAEADAFVRDYFAVLGEEAQSFVDKTPRDPARIRALIKEYADAGVDEVVFHPTAAALSQVDRLAQAVQ